MITSRKPELIDEYDGLQVYKIDDDNVWMRVVAGNILQALALSLGGGEYWGI